MAEFLWQFAVQEVLKKIVTYGAEQIGVAWGLEKEASQLKKQLQNAAAILVDINKKKLHQDSVRLWVEDLQDIVYEADDLLDELLYEDLRQTVEQIGKFEKVCDSISPSNNSFLFRLEMAKKMEDITETLYKHYCAASPLGLVGDQSSIIEREVALKQIRETTSILDFQVEGRDTEVLELLKLVIDSSNEHHNYVISIVGMGGLGKTTLAKMVFHHDTIKRHFDQTIWVCVSKPFIVMQILEEIFQALTDTCSGLKSKEALLRRLRKEMQDKKYFLVLDDVWDNDKPLWDELSGFLKHIARNPGNSIMVTTRNVEVATMVESISIHHLKKLSDDQCWALFKESANANQLPMNSKLEIVKKELVRKMGGVPLVAKVLGGAVKFEEGDYESWMTKVESIAENISMADKDFVLSILKLSVDYLPLPVLKQCFAYCSNFPQDYNFYIDELIQMWIAQGFIQPQQERENLKMEDIGEEYFNFLLSRSLFQDVTRDENKRIVTFKMHDLMHDIACAISNHPKMESNNPNNLSEKSVRKLRTLICDDEGKDYNVANDLVRLRVLKLNKFRGNVLWIPTNKLIHLRYLDISPRSYESTFLLESLSLLYNLQTLKLGYIESDLPKNLGKFVNLRHLVFHESGMEQMPSHMGNLIHLQTLSEFVVGFEKGCKIEELGPLKNLKGTLTLTNLRRVQNKDEAMAAKLAEKKNLRHLIFQWFSNFHKRGEYDEYHSVHVLEGLQPHKNLQLLVIISFQGKVLPNNIFVENLVELHLSSCRRCEVLPMLGQLPNLKKLWIESLNNVRSIGNEFYGIDSNHRNSFAFPQLKTLYIDGMKKLEQWDELISPNLFGSLQILQIFGCDKLTKLPSGLQSCRSIVRMVIRKCPNLMLNVQNLNNLYHLEIDGLKRLPEGLGELSMLKELIIKGCMQNYEFSSFIHLSSQLVELDLTDDHGSSTDNATTKLPQQLQHLTNLKFLKIVSFNGIESLPEWFGNLTSLETLKCFFCSNLKELPSREAMLRLTKLKVLDVHDCPELSNKEEQERAKLSDLPITLHVYEYKD